MLTAALAFINSPIGAALVLGVVALAWKYGAPLLDRGETVADAAIEKNAFFIKHPNYKSALEYIIDRTKIAVKSVGQTVVDSAKANGKLDASTAATAKSAAISAVKSLSSKEALEQLAVEMGLSADQAHQLDGVLGHIVESVVADQKAGASLPAIGADAVAAAVSAYMSGGPTPAQQIAAAASAGAVAGAVAAAPALASPEAGAQAAT